ncbi:phosphohydrolase [Candidatus Bathyarchaeota archaeon]|nr:MAG: phosphohydrolase [Candidatus Bathyarchaeota archaeon]
MHEGIVDFLQNAGLLKRVKRSGWISWVGIENPESVADHSYRSALIAMLIADLKGLDTKKLIQMLLLHDIHEALTGDYDYFAKREIGEHEVKKRNFEAAKKIFEKLPKNVGQKYFSIWLEFEEQETLEAKIARQIDQLEMIFQALEYEKEGYSREKLEVFWRNVADRIEDNDLKKIFEILAEKRKGESE